MTETSIENINSSGNTTTEPVSFKINARNVMITVNQASFEHLGDIWTYLTHYKSCNYCLCCSHDKPDLHYHIYTQYENTVKLDSRYLYGAHIEKTFGSSQQCINYCKGLDKKHQALGINCQVYQEYGTAKEKGGRRIKDILNMNEDDILELDANLYSSAMRIRGTKKTKVGEWHKDVRVIYIYGPSGVGKSKMAEELLIDNKIEEFTEVKHIGQFWHGIGGVEVSGAAIYDDFRDSHMTASEFINFIDYNIHNLNYKGGSAKNKFNLIIITSIQDPNIIYKNMKDEPRKQWLRRIEIIPITNNNDTHNLEQNHDDLSYESIPDYDKYMDELA